MKKKQANSGSRVLAVHANPGHEFSKRGCDAIQLLAGLGVEGDAHCGVTVKHRSRVARDPFQPNLRQVHLLHSELFDELKAQGFSIKPGDLGENITTRGIDLLALSTGCELLLGDEAVVRITGLRNPCTQLDKFQPGLTAAVLDRMPDGELVRKAGVMGVVLRGGKVTPGSPLKIHNMPVGVFAPLMPV